MSSDLTPEAMRRVIAMVTAHDAGITLSEDEAFDGVSALDVLRASAYVNSSVLGMLPDDGKQQVLRDLSAALTRIEQERGGPAPRVPESPWPPAIVVPYQPAAMAEVVGQLNAMLTGAEYVPDWDLCGNDVAEAALIVTNLALGRMPVGTAQQLLREMGEIATRDTIEPGPAGTP